MANPFDQFDGASNPFDQFSTQQAVSPGREPTFYHSLLDGLVNAATFNLAAPASAALGAITQENGNSQAPTFSQRYNENLARDRATDQAAATAHPAANIGGAIAGGFLNPVTRALPVANTVLGAMGQGAAVGAGYG